MNHTIKLMLLLSVSILLCQVSLAQTSDPWKEIDKILARINPPTFPNKNFDITKYGAVGDGKTDCTSAFAKAIQACHDAGGGKVIVPSGKFFSGPIRLLSNVNLNITKDATILFDRDTKKYLPQVLTRFEGIELMNYSPLIYAYQQENIAITGEGVLDGQAGPEYWWPWKAKGPQSQATANQRLKTMAKDNVPVAQRIFGEGDYLRPNFIQPYQCKRILIEGITIKDSPMWILHPVLSENITIRGVKINSHGPNNDGCDPESCKDVLIENCYFNTGDDCIAIKSGRDDDGRRVHTASENIIIQGCTMKDGHGGVVIGSEVSGDVRNVFAQDCEMNSPILDRALRLKSNPNRGGIMENIYMRNVKVGEVKEAILHIDLLYDKETGTNYPTVRNIVMENVTSEKSDYAVYVKGDATHPVNNVRMTNCKFNNVAKGNSLLGIEGLVMDHVMINGKESQ
jgi:polygalacturonase